MSPLPSTSDIVLPTLPKAFTMTEVTLVIMDHRLLKKLSTLSNSGALKPIFKDFPNSLILSIALDTNCTTLSTALPKKSVSFMESLRSDIKSPKDDVASSIPRSSPEKPLNKLKIPSPIAFNASTPISSIEKTPLNVLLSLAAVLSLIMSRSENFRSASVIL